MHANPYGEDLGNRDPLEALGETPIRIRTIVERWGDDHFERSYAPGKWSARQILAHLAQTELALTTRARFALSTPGYVAQPFSQDDWVPLDQGAEARTALDAYIVLQKAERRNVAAPVAGSARAFFSASRVRRAQRQLDHVAAGGARIFII